MLRHKNQLFMIISLISTPVLAKDFIDDFFEAEKHVMGKAHAGAKGLKKEVDTGIKKAEAGLTKAGQEIKKAGQEVKQAIVSAFDTKLQINIHEEDSMVVTTIKGIKATKVDATINDENDTLTIKADSTDVTVYAQDKILTVAVRHTNPQTIKAGDKEIQTFNAASIQESRTISSPVMLDKQTINYDQTKEELVITLPKSISKKTGKPVTVNIIGKQEVQSEEKSIDTKTSPMTPEKAANQEPIKANESTIK